MSSTHSVAWALGFAEVSATGGDSREILLPDRVHEADLHQSSFLPDGSVVFVVRRLPEGQDTIAVLTDGVRKTLLRFELEILGNPVYSTTGHIVFRRTRSKAGLWTAPFSLAGLEVTGEPFLITPQGTLPSVSDDGTLLYVNGAVTGLHQLVWVSRDGVIGESVGQPQTGIAAPALSPDGRHIICWDRITHALSMKAADGTGELIRLVEQNLPDSGVPSLSLDGKWMAFWVKHDGAGAGPVVHRPGRRHHPQTDRRHEIRRGQSADLPRRQLPGLYLR